MAYTPHGHHIPGTAEHRHTIPVHPCGGIVYCVLCKIHAGITEEDIMEKQLYGRKAFTVEAVQVTAENMAEVAEWCGGEIKSKPNRGRTENYIQVPTHRPLNEKQTQAFVSDWVLESNSGFKVYTDKPFRASFELQTVYTDADGEDQLKDYDTPPIPAGNVFDNVEAEKEPEEDKKVEEPETTRGALGFNEPKNLFKAPEGSEA